jgi:hypothetical protein
MKLALSIAALALVLPQLSLAEEGFDKRKAEALANMDEHIQALQKNRECVSAATDREGLKKCRDTMKDFRKGERLEQMGKRGSRLEKRMDKLKSKGAQGEAPGTP